MPKIVLCHCEDVELEELYSALEQGYGDIETLKRYTGIGTGKCQGKCCFVQTLRVLQALKTQSTSEQKRHTPGAKATLMGNPSDLRIPTLRPPVLPIRIDDLIEDRESES